MDKGPSSVRIFSESMDQVSSDESIGMGFYRLAYNARNGPRNRGRNDNIQGNIKIQNPFLDAGAQHVCVGCEEEIKDTSALMFIWSSLGTHGIYRYYINKAGFITGVIEKIFKVKDGSVYTADNPNPLSFDSDMLITGINVVGDMLFWNGKSSSPKKLNLLKANDTNKRRKFSLLLNRSNFNNFTEYTMNVYAPGNPVPLHTMVWTSGSFNYTERTKDFFTAYQSNTALQAFLSATNFGSFAEIEMTSAGDYFINISEITFRSQRIAVSVSTGNNQYVLYFDNLPSTALVPGDQVVLYGLNVIGFLNGVTITILSGGMVGTGPGGYFIADGPIFSTFDFMSEDASMVFLPLTQITPTTSQSVVMPANFYPDKDVLLEAGGVINYDYLSPDLFERAKFPPKIQPDAKYETDVKREINLVKNSVFQFRLNYIYEDYENTVYGAISIIPINNISCDDSKNYGDNDNYIRVDFPDERLHNVSKCCIIKQVRLAVREHNDGEWREVKVLEQYEFAGAGQTNYFFYNDQSLRAIPSIDTNEPWDNVGIIEESQEVVDDRLFTGDITEGYDPPHINAKVAVEYLDAATDNFFYIRGRIYIRNAFSLDADYANQQPIWVPPAASGQTVFGGMGPALGLGLEQYIWGTDMIGRYNQDIPLQGFVVYAAATNYFTVSKQNPTSAMNGNGYYGGTSNAQRKDIRDEINNDNVFSTFELRVKPGRYVLRIAGHHTTQEDLLDPDRGYQKTSTYVTNMGGSHSTEVIVDVTNADVNIPDTDIADISSPTYFSGLWGAKPLPFGGLASTNIAGYLVDDDAGVLPANYADWLNDTRIERAMIDNNTTADLGSIFLAAITSGIGFFTKVWDAYVDDERATTDHNGYFWYATLNPLGGNVNIGTVHIGAFNGSVSAIDQTSTPFTGRSVFGTAQIAIRNVNDDVGLYGRTYLEGRAIKKNTIFGILGASVVNTHGHVGKTDTNGDFRVVCYVDTVWALYGTPAGNFRKDEVIVFEGSALCLTDPAYVAKPYDITIEQVTVSSPPQYDEANIFYTGLYEFLILSSATSVNYFKRGSDIIFALSYYDKAHRRCPPVSGENLKAHITFETERNPFTNVIDPQGPANISWEIFHEPPPGAVTYQWLRTINLQHGPNYLRWSVNNALYVTRNDVNLTNVGIGNADFLVLDFQNVSYYSLFAHPEAEIAFNFEAGDRVRFIKDDLGNFFTEYLDYEIVKVVGPFVYVYVDANFEAKKNYLVELFSPLKRTKFDEFFEFGETFEIKTAIINGVRRAYHAGLTNDQSFGPLPGQVVTPARGTFRTGDGYYRRRSIPTQAVVGNQIGPPPPIVNPSSGTEIIFNIVDAAISDFYRSTDQSIGRLVTSAETIGRVHNKSLIRFSLQFIAGSKTNGLCSFRALNNKPLPVSFGSVQKLKLRDNSVLVAICENSASMSMYINTGVLRQALGAELLSISSDVIPRTHKTQRTLGTVNPESVVLNDQGDLFWWDEYHGSWIRMSGNDLVIISNYGMGPTFRDKGNRRMLKDRSKSKVPAVFDLYFDELQATYNQLSDAPGEAPTAEIIVPDYDDNGTPFMVIVTIKPLNIQIASLLLSGTGSSVTQIIAAINLSGTGFTASLTDNGLLNLVAPNNAAVYANQTVVIEIIGGPNITKHMSQGKMATNSGVVDPAETPVFVVDKNGWTDFRRYTPEYYGRIGNEILSFVNGELWLHHKNPLYNNFYGVQYVRQIKFVENVDWKKVKGFKAMGQVAKWPNYCPEITIPPGAQTPIGMLSSLNKTHFETKENKHYAAFKRDKNSPVPGNIPAPMVIPWAWNSGRVLRGQALTVTLEDDTTEVSSLISTEIEYFYSELS